MFIKYATVASLFHLYPSYTEGQLTKVKDAAVSNKALARLATAAGLHRYIRALPFRLRAWRPPGLDRVSSVGIVVMVAYYDDGDNDQFIASQTLAIAYVLEVRANGGAGKQAGWLQHSANDNRRLRLATLAPGPIA